MEEFNYTLNETNENDAIEQLSFINRNDFSSSDVDRVLFEAQDSLLGAIGSETECQDTSSFLNPINDILGDINEFSKQFCCDQVGGMSSLPPAMQAHSVELNCAWSSHDANDQSHNSGDFLSDRSKLGASVSTAADAASTSVAVEINNNMENGMYNMQPGNENSVLLSDSPLIEFPTTDCGIFEEYSSAINQWFQGVEQQQQQQTHQPQQQQQQQQQQMSYINTTLSTLPYTTHMQTTTTQGYTDAFLNTIGSLPASTTITPITLEEHQLTHRPISPARHEVTIETRFLPPDRSVIDDGNKIPTEVLLPTRNGTGMPNEYMSIASQDDMIGKLISYADQTDWKQCNSMRQPPPAYFPTQIPTLSLYNNGTRNTSCNTQQFFQQKTSTPAYPAVRRTPDMAYQKNRLHWAPVFPHKHFVQPPKMVIMHPLRTRKLVASARRPINNGCNNYTNTTVNLSEYFDTSCIDIPMIKERDCVQARKNRRKQKLSTIPGAENFIFEVQKNESDDFSCGVPSVLEIDLSSEMDPYPETELPELDEIFRRKKKTSSVATSNNKKISTISSHATGNGNCDVAGNSSNNINMVNTLTAPVRKLSQPHAVATTTIVVAPPQTSPVPQESSTSFEEKVSVSTMAIRKARSNLSIDKNELIYSSETDSGASGDENEERVLQNKSLKCQKCRKLFKTTRSLAIHTKRCTAVRHNSVSSHNTETPDEDGGSSVGGDIKHAAMLLLRKENIETKSDQRQQLQHQQQQHQQQSQHVKMNKLPLELGISNSECSGNNNSSSGNEYMIMNNVDMENDMKISNAETCSSSSGSGGGGGNDNSKARPITRSQTRRSIGRSIPLLPMNMKRAK